MATFGVADLEAQGDARAQMRREAMATIASLREITGKTKQLIASSRALMRVVEVDGGKAWGAAKAYQPWRATSAGANADWDHSRWSRV